MESRKLPYRSILFVCDANTCRSPMAELLLKRMLENLGVDSEIQVRSGGISSHARDDSAISLDAQLILKAEGIPSPADFRSRDISRHRELLVETDLVLTMTSAQKERVEKLEEADGKEVCVLREFVGEQGDIADPRGYAEIDYLDCMNEIYDCLKKAMGRLVPGQAE